MSLEVVSCGPYVCEFPRAKNYAWHERWTCPKCGTTYIRRVQLWNGVGFCWGAFWSLTTWADMRHNYADPILRESGA